MNTIVPLTIILSLGAGSGLILMRWLSNIWITSIMAGIVATFLWGIGMEVLFQLTIPDKDMGETHYEGILIVFLVTSVASLVSLIYVKIKNKNTNNGMQSDSRTSGR
jgi:hypothetical protein